MLLALLLGGCARDEPTSDTRLAVVALNASVGRAVFHLACSPKGGDFPNAVKACELLETRPELVTKPKPFVCIGGTFSWWDVTVTGLLEGKSIRRSFSTCWTPQMETLGQFGLTWAVLKKHLVPRRHEVVAPGTARVFPPGVLRATDLVTCDILGHHLEAGVPLGVGQPASVGFGGASIVGVTLEVTRESDGSVRGSCDQEL